MSRQERVCVCMSEKGVLDQGHVKGIADMKGD